MSLVASQHHFTHQSHPTTTVDDPKSPPDNTNEATLSSLLGAYTNPESNPMDRGGAPEFPQSGLHSSYPHALTNAQAEETPADNPSAPQYPSQQVEVKPSPNQNQTTYSATGTPTPDSAYYPGTTRSGSFPDPNLHRTYHPSSNHSGSSSAGMAQPNSPSLPLQDGSSSHQNNQIKSDQDVSIDPSIAASSPTYPPHSGQYSPYPPQQEMQHGYPSHQSGGMYPQPRPDWAGYAGSQGPHGMPGGGGYAVSGAHTPSSAAATQRPGPVSVSINSP